MRLLALDIGSSSIKAGILLNGRIVGESARVGFVTSFEGARAEVDPNGLLRALARAVGALGNARKQVDCIALATMSPAWVAMDGKGRPLTPIVTHQDRRSVDVAAQIEERVGRRRHLQIAGNRPFPGGISSTTWEWFRRNDHSLARRADLVGHLNTFLHRKLTGARVIDPSNASFTGLYETVEQGSWSEELCAAVHLPKRLLPEIVPASAVAGNLTRGSARRLGLTAGTPMLAGIVDTSAAMLLAGARSGQLLNVCGTTDVLALCVAAPTPHEKLLTRALGVGRKWMSVSTLASAGSTISWAKEQLFGELSLAEFHRLIGRLVDQPPQPGITFQPYLAGERTSIEQKTASLSGLTLGAKRQEILWAILDGLARASGERVPLLRANHTRILPTVCISGGLAGILHHILHRDWPRRWKHKRQEEMTLRGLGKLVD